MHRQSDALGGSTVSGPGGLRERAGRKPLGDRNMVGIRVLVPPEYAEQLRALGPGMMSQQVREAIRLYLSHQTMAEYNKLD